MSDKNYAYLQELLSTGHIVWWFDRGCGWRPVVSLAPKRDHQKEEEREPGPVAYFNNGEYIALDAVLLCDLMATSGNILKWPE